MEQKLISEGGKYIRFNPNYIITESGDVYSIRRDIFMVKSVSNGYYVVNFRKGTSKKTFSIHRLVATHFLKGTPDQSMVNHLDGNKLNNHYINLEWTTPAGNNKHAYENNLTPKTPKNRPKLSQPINQLDANGNLIKTYPSAKEAERQTGLWQTSICVCANRGRFLGKRWIPKKSRKHKNYIWEWAANSNTETITIK